MRYAMENGEENISGEYDDSTDDNCSSDDETGVFENGVMTAEFLERERKYQESRKPTRVYTQEEIDRDLQKYNHQVNTTEGFDVDYFPSLDDYYCMIFPLSHPNEKRIRECAQIALNHYNQDNGSKYELVDVLKVTSNAAGQEVLRMTFVGKDDNGDNKIFLGVVYEGIPDKRGNPDREFMSCKLKPDQ